MICDELGPEAVLRVHDPVTGMRGVVVIDNTMLGPAGGGTRMVADLDEDEVAALARAMTYKWATFGLPTGGAKAGVFGDPGMPPERKRAVMRAFGRALAPYLQAAHEGHLVGIGPDMGISGADTEDIYAGAGCPNVCPTLYTWRVDGDPASYHVTGIGVVAAARAALASVGRPIEGATFAIEGFGQVGAGTARYAVRAGARVIAVSTLRGGVHDPQGLDVQRLLELRRQHGDDCVRVYGAGTELASDQLFGVDADVIVPGARPRSIHGYNAGIVQAPARLGVRLVCPAGNLCVTEEAEAQLHRRGVVCVPDFVANAGGIIASWADMLGAAPAQALSAVQRLVGDATTLLFDEAKISGVAVGPLARARVRDRLLARGRERHRPTAEQARAQAKDVLRLG